MLNHVVPCSPVVRSALLVLLGWSGATAASAQTLEERVSILEQQQGQQSSALQLVNELAGKVEVSGFVSIRGGQIDAENVTYLNTIDDKWTFSEESVAGLQVNTRVSDKVSVSLQLKAGSQLDGVEMEWGYLEYTFAPDLKLRAGRLRVPGFMLSEYLDVGYAYPWVSVPIEVYGWLPFSRYEGLDLRYWTSVGDVDIRLTPYLGTTADQALNLGNIHYTDQTAEFAGLDVQLTYDILTMRAGYSKYKFRLKNSVLDAYLGPVVDGVTLVPEFGDYIDGVAIPGLTTYVQDVMVGQSDGSGLAIQGSGILADAIYQIQQLDPSWETNPTVMMLQAEQQSLLQQLVPYQNVPTMDGHHDGEFYGLGFSLDNGQYQIMSEVSRSEITGAYPDVESGYVMLGYRFGNWMPHFTFAKMYTINDDERPRLDAFEVNPLIWGNPALTGVVDGLMTYTGALITVMNIVRLEQETYTLGLRWDPTAGLAVKAEAFYVDLKNGSYGFAIPSTMLAISESNLNLAGAEDGFDFQAPEDGVTGFRLSIDVVF